MMGGKLRLSVTSKIFVSLLVLLSGLTMIIRYWTYRRLLTATHPDDSEIAAFSDIYIPPLQLIPWSTLFNPWVLFTSTFVETTLVRFGIACAIWIAGCDYCEKNWNFDEVANARKRVFSETVYYVSLCAVFTNLTSVLTVITGYLIQSDLHSDYLKHPLNHGCFVMLMPFLVVAKQLSPEHEIKLFKGTLYFRFKQLPFLILVVSCVCSLFTLSWSPILPIMNSFLISWTYLRFFQINPVTLDLLPSTVTTPKQFIRGDASITFAMQDFFPEVLRPWIKPACRVFYHMNVFLGIITGFNEDEVEAGNLRAIKRINTSSTVSARGAAERRRQVALKVLEERGGSSQRVGNQVTESQATQ